MQRGLSCKCNDKLDVEQYPCNGFVEAFSGDKRWKSILPHEKCKVWLDVGRHSKWRNAALLRFIACSAPLDVAELGSNCKCGDELDVEQYPFKQHSGGMFVGPHSSSIENGQLLVFSHWVKMRTRMILMSVNAPLSAGIREEYIKFMMHEPDETIERFMIAHWIAHAKWRITPDVIMNGFRKIGIFYPKPTNP
jgi:hypothetical protein